MVVEGQVRTFLGYKIILKEIWKKDFFDGIIKKIIFWEKLKITLKKF